MLAWFLSLALTQAAGHCRVQAEPYLATAAERAELFDLGGAADMFFAASGQWCVDAEIAGHYVRGILAARDAYKAGGSPQSLAPVRLAIAAIDARAPDVPALAALARATLLAAAAGAQSERDEMALYLEQAVRLETIQIEADQPALPAVSAHEVAADLWLQVHRYEDAQHAYDLALERVGATPRVMLGLARAAARLNESAAACGHYQRLLAWWDTRRDRPAEIAEARSFTAQPVCSGAASVRP